jgi:hypothetical protein
MFPELKCKNINCAIVTSQMCTVRASCGVFSGNGRSLFQPVVAQGPRVVGEGATALCGSFFECYSYPPGPGSRFGF